MKYILFLVCLVGSTNIGAQSLGLNVKDYIQRMYLKNYALSYSQEFDYVNDTWNTSQGGYGIVMECELETCIALYYTPFDKLTSIKVFTGGIDFVIMNVIRSMDSLAYKYRNTVANANW